MMQGMRCDNPDCSRPSDNPDYLRHYFPMYGSYLHYHAECCPGHGDGSICGDDHAPGSPAALFVAANTQDEMNAGIYHEA